MLDQTFSAGNLRRIYEVENRKGRNVDQAFFPLLVEASARITVASAALRAARRDHAGSPDAALNAILDPLKSALADLREARDDLVDETMNAVAETIANGYQIHLEQRTGPASIPIYTLPQEAPAYFIGKQLQENIGRLYRVRAGNRRAITNQLYDSLNNSFSKYVIRTDITSFYESIDRSRLIAELENDQLLSLGSKRYIKQALASYGALSGSAQGIPRGLGVSAYLSELYMRSVDEHIKQLPSVTYYARYVDDIVVVFALSFVDDPTPFLAAVSGILVAKGLDINTNKTVTGRSGAGHNFQIDYLGFRYSIAAAKCRLDISTAKANRYRARIGRVFATYQRMRHLNEKAAARLLVSRIKFMTSNTQLVNNKRHAFTGVYYNNSHITELGSLNSLDAYLRYRTAQLTSPALQNRLDQLSFRVGFEERRFVRYSTIEMARVVKAWRYEA